MVSVVMKHLIKISVLLFFLVSITNKVFAENVSELFSNLIPGEGITEASIQINEDDNPDNSLKSFNPKLDVDDIFLPETYL